MKFLSGLVILMTATAMLGFQHGDRPAPNSGGTRSPVLAMNGMVATSQPWLLQQLCAFWKTVEMRWTRPSQQPPF